MSLPPSPLLQAKMVRVRARMERDGWDADQAAREANCFTHFAVLSAAAKSKSESISDLARASQNLGVVNGDLPTILSQTKELSLTSRHERCPSPPCLHALFGQVYLRWGSTSRAPAVR